MPAGRACSPGRAAVRVAAVTALAFAALGIHIATGGAYEVRTLAAMTLRTLLWARVADMFA